jgi:CRP-like cAMP-binding protein
MHLMKLPTALQNRINEYYQCMWNRYGTLDGKSNRFTSELSKNLATEVELYLRMDMISRAPFFTRCSKKFVQEIVMSLDFQVYMGGDYIIIRGEVGEDMYFVQSGMCEVTKELNRSTFEDYHQTLQEQDGRGRSEETVVKVLTQGDYFGNGSMNRIRAHI